MPDLRKAVEDVAETEALVARVLERLPAQVSAPTSPCSCSHHGPAAATRPWWAEPGVLVVGGGLGAVFFLGAATVALATVPVALVVWLIIREVRKQEKTP